MAASRLRTQPFSRLPELRRLLSTAGRHADDEHLQLLEGLGLARRDAASVRFGNLPVAPGPGHSMGASHEPRVHVPRLDQNLRCHLLNARQPTRLGMTSASADCRGSCPNEVVQLWKVLMHCRWGALWKVAGHSAHLKGMMANITQSTEHITQSWHPLDELVSHVGNL